MARDYFIQTTSLVPPRGVRVEMTEIRPLRPNQAVILPGVAVLGQGLKFEVNILAAGRLGLRFAFFPPFWRWNIIYNLWYTITY